MTRVVYIVIGTEIEANVIDSFWSTLEKAEAACKALTDEGWDYFVEEHEVQD